MQSANNTDQFLLLLNANKGIIFKVANSYCVSADDRKDLVQEIILQAWKSFHKYSDLYAYSTFIYRIALNVAISFYRKDKRRKQSTDALTDDILSAADPPAQLAEELALLQQCIRSLPPLDKALMLLYLDERPYSEIAAIMDLTVTNVATKIARIKKSIQQQFNTLNK